MDRETERLRIREYRKRISAEYLEEQSTTTPTAGPAILTAYKSARSLGKAVARSRHHLPCSPRKAKEVVRNLASSYQLINPTWKAAETFKIPVETTDAVKLFYCKDSISRQAPGRKDAIVIRNEDGTKEHYQKRHMLMTLREAHLLFRKESPQYEIGKSKFAELRPPYVLYMSQIPANVCVCPYHSNFNLLLAALHEEIPSFPGNHSDLLVQIGCDLTDSECMSVDCLDCKNALKELVLSVKAAPERQISYKQWGRDNDGHIAKVSKQETFEDATDELAKQFLQFLPHHFVKVEQSQFFQKLMKKVSPENVLLQVDFSENFTIIHQDAIQADHWTNKMVSIYTAVTWFKTAEMVASSCSYVIVSDYQQHDKYAACIFNQMIIDELIKHHTPQMQDLHIFSDGAAQHFKQRFTISKATLIPDICVYWHFFATSHGKGAVDGIGGTIKRQVYHEIMARRSEPEDAAEFAAIAQKTASKIKVLYCPAVNINDVKEVSDAQWVGVKPIPGLHSIHSIRMISPYRIMHAQVSSSLTFQYFVMKETDRDNDSDTQVNKKVQGEAPSTVINVIEPQCGKWYAVFWPENTYWFLGLCISVDNNFKIAKFEFLHQTTTTMNEFKSTDDVDVTCWKNIFYAVHSVPEPILKTVHSTCRSLQMKIADVEFREICERFDELYQ